MEEKRVRSPYQPPQTTCAVQIYPHGTITDRGHLAILTQPGITRHKVRRSAITTLSRHSAARLRRLLAQVRGPEGWECFGLTMTVPGPPITMDEWHRVWNAFRHRLLRLGTFTLIWRIELQERGQPHVHCVCWGEYGPGRIREYWLESLGLLGPAEGAFNTTAEGTISSALFGKGIMKPGWVSVDHRGAWPGARERAVEVDELDTNNSHGWWYYLATHASKSKQAQLGWKGRQWGKVNVGLIDLHDPILIELPHTAMNKVTRCLKRLSRCRFASGHGRQTWFVRPATVQRICDWAKASV